MALSHHPVSIKVTSKNCFTSDLRNTDFFDVAIARKS
ncbi:MAG: hypothetical protein IKY43_03590 [Bacteroidales bacterium]|nr:hypothetical protein [Bacteroidales bacterium]